MLMIDVDVKELIFLVVFIGIIAVPISLSVLFRKKKNKREKKNDRG